MTIEMFNPIFYIFLSYGLGALGTTLIRYSGNFDKFENHNYISDNLTKQLGVLVLGLIIRKTVLGAFNPSLKYKGRRHTEKLEKLKMNMTLAENSHLIAFILLQIFIFVLACIGVESWQLIVYTISNIIFNLYLVFLQQFNKRRIDRLLKLKVD
ncbi:MAG: hypothetical protein AAF502_17240 [Bacteroidota bacterium]